MAKIFGPIAVLAFLLAMPFDAAAQAPDAILGDNPTARRWFTLRLGYGSRSMGSKEITLTRHDAVVGATVYFFPWLGVSTNVHVGVLDSSFKYALSGGYRMDSALRDRGMTVETEAHIGVFASDPVLLEVFAGYEFAPYQPRLTVSSAMIDTPLGEFDCSKICRHHMDFSYELDDLYAGLAAHVRLWRFVPRLAVRYQRISAKFDPRIDREAETLLGSYGFDPEVMRNDLSGEAGFPTVSPGLYVDLPYGLGLDAELNAAPLKIRSSTFMTFRAGVSWSY